MTQDDDGSIERYVDEMIRSVPEVNRPDPQISCRQGCPKANWLREKETLRCYCHAMGVFSWPRLNLERCTDRQRALRPQS
ncbi:hypothetical protein SFC76_12405 [Sphingomonas sp. CD22]|uniref:hypothetical protein n=1 Tax=Sphingomonas sp. CD22 TaxID=3100214 RepID=UPI0010DA29FA|nr:hypothetical protein [Sphingomonas sp. CD22]MEA1085063.1 hypothetical protein [Sphingomonas sp. CD22]RYD26785.1 MAG: hypothetical protein EOP89_06275 [Xanthomonadaceae bacterium]